ncbi:MAG: hypothetical protein Tsb0027_17950 [Wenzhouxiangellaceae bacterium]
MLLLGACAAPAPRPEQPLTPLRQATTELPAADVLNVNVTVFEADLPTGEAPEIQQIYRDIRAAEARYIPYHLRQVLEASGHWGDVRVVPEATPAAELKISGRILESHGDQLRLQILAVDASDRVWLDRQYQAVADVGTYNRRRGAAMASAEDDPFQDIYHRIANDLVAARAELPAVDKLAVQQLAEIRFAADLAPQAYADLLQRERSRLRLRAMPPADDPLLARIDLAAQRDAAMVDTLDQYYRDFHQRMAEPYQSWRAASYQEIRNLRELQYQARSRKALGGLAILAGVVGLATASDDCNSRRESNSRNRDNCNRGRTTSSLSVLAIAGGAYALSSGIDKGRQTNMHVASLQELARSLGNDMQPRTLALRDNTVRLTGSAEFQYREWRALLAEMIEADVMSPPTPSADTDLQPMENDT